MKRNFPVLNGWVALGLAMLAGVWAGTARGEGLYREWVRTYRLDPAKTNAATKIALTADGIVVAGTSASSAGDADYLIIKYNSNGDEVWTRRYDSLTGAQDNLRDLAVDAAGNIFVTGTSDTVKYSASGNLVWSQLYGGRALAVNTNFVYVTGFSDVDFATVQLTNNETDGGKAWIKYFDAFHDEDISAAVAIAPSGNILVAGWETVGRTTAHTPINKFLLISYSTNGTALWQVATNQANGFPGSQYISGLMFDSSGSAYMLGSFEGDPPRLAKLSSGGVILWLKRWSNSDVGYGMKFTPQQNIVCVGDGVISEFTTDSTLLWTQVYETFSDESATTCVDIAPGGKIFAAGYKFKENTLIHRDLFLLEVTPDGSTNVPTLFDSPQQGNDIANAIAIDEAGSVYVTGSSTTAEGGTEFVTIKYSPNYAMAQAKADGSVHLEFGGNAGQRYAIEASANFLNWQGLVTNVVDADGVFRFDDTNVVSARYRFYRGNSAP